MAKGRSTEHVVSYVMTMKEPVGNEKNGAAEPGMWPGGADSLA